MDPVIQIRGLSKSFGGEPVLRGVNLTIPRGRITTVIGSSGSGKSVLIKHIVGLLPPDDGSIVVDGQEIVGLSGAPLRAIRRKFGLLFQHSALFDSMNVFENVSFPLREHTRLPRKVIRERVERVLDLLRLPGVGSKYPAELSGGMRKRVGLARAVILEPEIVIYDEPTTGLDPIMIREVDEMIRDIGERLGITSVVISHDMASTFRLSHHIGMICEGQIRLEGPPDLFRSTADEEVAKFIYATRTDTGGEVAA